MTFCKCAPAHRKEWGTRLELGVEVCDFCLKPYPTEHWLLDGTNEWAQVKADLRASRNDYRKPAKTVGNIVLTIWIGIIAITALIMFGVFISNPGDFIKEPRKQTCTIVETPDGGAIDTCEYLRN